MAAQLNLDIHRRIMLFLEPFLVLQLARNTRQKLIEIAIKNIPKSGKISY